MVEVSIVCLIYKSKQLAEALYESVLRYTPMLASGQAEFFFIANDPTEEVVGFLKEKNIPHYVNVNERLEDEKLFSMGFGTPEYMRRVYQGYNRGILEAKGQKVALINSDNFFSEDWLENLLKYSDYKKVVSSTLIEPGHENFGVFPFAIEKDFGHTLDDFKENDFQDFAEKIAKTGYSSGGAYMPCLLYKDIAVMAGLYPEGNIAGKSFEEVSRFGDEYFYDMLKEFGVEHITAKDSIVYHLKEGEKAEPQEDARPYSTTVTRMTKFNERLIVRPTKLISYISPEIKHQKIMEELGRKATVLINNPENVAEVDWCLRTIKGFNFKNIETVLISEDKEIIKKFNKQLKTVYATKRKTDRALYEAFHSMFGEHLLVLNKLCKYEEDIFDAVISRDAMYYFGGEVQVDEITTDYAGHFIIPKKALVSRIPTFLEFLIGKNKIKVNFKDFDVVNISKVTPAVLEPIHEPLTVRNFAPRTMKKVQKDGVKALARLIKDRALKK